MTLQNEIFITDYCISTDKSRLDRNYIHAFIARRSYWAQGISRALLDLSIDNALCFGVYLDNKQVGFARVITDYATFGYLADVFIDEGHRGKGLSKHLIEFITSLPELNTLRRVMLCTRDAQSLYSHYGFRPLAAPSNFMEIHKPDVYKNL